MRELNRRTEWGTCISLSLLAANGFGRAWPNSGIEIRNADLRKFLEGTSRSGCRELNPGPLALSAPMASCSVCACIHNFTTRPATAMTPVGLEPAIPGSVGRCLIHWATGPIDTPTPFGYAKKPVCLPAVKHDLREPTSLSMWPRGVTVSTLDSESSDRGLNPREAFA